MLTKIEFPLENTSVLERSYIHCNGRERMDEMKIYCWSCTNGCLKKKNWKYICGISLHRIMKWSVYMYGYWYRFFWWKRIEKKYFVVSACRSIGQRKLNYWTSSRRSGRYNMFCFYVNKRKQILYQKYFRVLCLTSRPGPRVYCHIGYMRK